MSSEAVNAFFKGQTIVGSTEDLPVQNHHDVYPTIDPTVNFVNKTFAGKIVLITGASRGIGQEIAIHFARAGASLVLVSRTQEALDKTKAAVLKQAPDAQILTFPVDVKDSDKAADAVAATVSHFGKLDVVIPNAGVTSPLNSAMIYRDPKQWWHTFEVNVLGVFNFVSPALEHLKKANGYVIATSSNAAQMRFPLNSDYCTSKHALGRLIEYIALEYPEVKAFAVHPGSIRTQLSADAGVGDDVPMLDTLQLPASTMLYIASGKADWLSGRYVAATWDLGEVERDWKTKILEGNALVSKLHIPSA